LIHVRQRAWNARVLPGTKTANSRNSVPMCTVIVEKLDRYLSGHKHELLFPNRNGDPYTSSKLNERRLHPVLDKLGIPRKGKRMGNHAFRHALASMLVDTTSAAVAQRQLRHSDASTTLGIYAHVIGSGHFDAVESIAQTVCGGV